MALTYGIESLAVINKGGGLRRLASGQTTEYLRGDMTWTAFPTTMAPTAHNHSASEINTGTLELARLPRIAAGSIYVGAGTSNDILTLAKGSALQALRTNAAGTALEWYTTPWKDGQYGTGSIKTNHATATGLRSGDGAKPYVYWSALAGQDLKAGGLAGADQKWMLISPSTEATYAYGGVEYTYNNTTANYVFLILIDSADFIGSTTAPFNRCRIIANAGTTYLADYRTILTVGSPITGNVYPVIVSTGSSTAPSGISYTESVSLYAPLKSNSVNYNGYYSVASGFESVASGRYSVASGQDSVASGIYSVASGLYSVASGGSSVASGGYSVASGTRSVALGNRSVASGDASVASGNYSVASGYFSVASGQYSVASGAASVASGQYSVASGTYSVALGRHSVASGAAQTVIGKYNVANTSSAFIIGNGTSSARSNCMTVDFSGNMNLAGSIAIGASGDLTIPKHAGLNRLAYFDSEGKLQSSASYNLESFALDDHDHLIPDLFCGEPNIVAGRILISGEGASSNPTWLAAGENGQILGWTSDAPAWVDAPFADADHTHLYAGSSSAGGAATTALECSGNAATATKLAASVTLTIGSKDKSFDGSANVTWSLADIGAAPAIHNHDATYLKLSGGTVTGQITLGSNGGIYKSGWDGNKIPYFVSGEMTVSSITIDSFADKIHEHSTDDLTSGTLSVEHGGTGKSSLTANAILLGGTTSTGALQQMSLGTARQVLASGGESAKPQWLTADEYERFSVGGTAEGSATVISAKTGISEKLVFIDPGAATTPQTTSYFKAPLAANQEYGDRIVIYCCSGNETYKYIVLPNGTERFCDLIGGQYTGNIEASYGNKIELVCLPKSGAKAWYVSRIALINNN